MDYFEIIGKKQLNGIVKISGAKNAVLPVMAASILNDSPLKLNNVPTLSDSRTMASILESMGSKVVFINNNSINIDNSSLDNPFASYDLVRTMRASFYVLGPLLARFKNHHDFRKITVFRYVQNAISKPYARRPGEGK